MQPKSNKQVEQWQFLSPVMNIVYANSGFPSIGVFHSILHLGHNTLVTQQPQLDLFRVVLFFVLFDAFFSRNLQAYLIFHKHLLVLKMIFWHQGSVITYRGELLMIILNTLFSFIQPIKYNYKNKSKIIYTNIYSRISCNFSTH